MVQRARLIVKEAPGVDVESWDISGACTTIGRWEGSHIPLPDREVSRKHAQIRHEGGRFILVDLGSKNGTLVNGQAVAGVVILTDGDEITVPPRYRFLFVDSEATEPAPGRVEGVRVDAVTRQAYVGDHIIAPPLTPSQFALLALLASHPGKVFDRDAVAAACYPDAEGGVSDQAIEGLVRRLRARLSEADPASEHVEALRGHGLRLRT